MTSIAVDFSANFSCNGVDSDARSSNSAPTAAAFGAAADVPKKFAVECGAAAIGRGNARHVALHRRVRQFGSGRAEIIRHAGGSDSAFRRVSFGVDQEWILARMAVDIRIINRSKPRSLRSALHVRMPSSRPRRPLETELQIALNDHAKCAICEVAVGTVDRQVHNLRCARLVCVFVRIDNFSGSPSGLLAVALRIGAFRHVNLSLRIGA